jgi:hypothetical protein
LGRVSDLSLPGLSTAKTVCTGRHPQDRTATVGHRAFEIPLPSAEVARLRKQCDPLIEAAKLNPQPALLCAFQIGRDKSARDFIACVSAVPRLKGLGYVTSKGKQFSAAQVKRLLRIGKRSECSTYKSPCCSTPLLPWPLAHRLLRSGTVAGLVGIDGGVVSGLFNPNESGVDAPEWRPRHDEHYHEALCRSAGS